MATIKRPNLDDFTHFLGFLRCYASMSAHKRSCNTPKWPSNEALSGSKEKNCKIFNVTMVTMQETAIFDHFDYFWGFLGSHGSMSAYTRSCNTPKWPSNQGLTGSKEKNWKIFSVTMVTMQETAIFDNFAYFWRFWGVPRFNECL